MLRIESTSNDKIKLAVKVATSAKCRKETGLFFLEGLRLCRDAALTGYEIETTFITDFAAEKFSEDIDFITSSSEYAYLISESIEKKITQAQTPQGIFCLCRMKKICHEINFSSGKYVALENIQDPANFGAILRTAEALGISGAITFQCCDIYNPKTQRAAMGSALRLPVIKSVNLCETLTDLAKKGMKLYATTPDNGADKITNEDLSGGIIAVIGNEGNGVSDEVFEICRKVTIPMAGRAESLNASMAAAITMWEMMRSDG